MLFQLRAMVVEEVAVANSAEGAVGRPLEVTGFVTGGTTGAGVAVTAGVPEPGVAAVLSLL